MKTTVGLPVVVVLFVMGCATTQQVAVKEEPGICTFLGEVCHELQIKRGSRPFSSSRS